LKVENRKWKVDKDLFFKIVKAGFSQPRKQLANNLIRGLALSLPKGLALSSSNGLKLDKEKVKKWLSESNIQSTKRAENLSMENWLKLIKNYTI